MLSFILISQWISHFVYPMSVNRFAILVSSKSSFIGPPLDLTSSFFVFFRLHFVFFRLFSSFFVRRKKTKKDEVRSGVKFLCHKFSHQTHQALFYPVQFCSAPNLAEQCRCNFWADLLINPNNCLISSNDIQWTLVSVPTEALNDYLIRQLSNTDN